MQLSELRIAVLESFTALQDALTDLSASIKSETHLVSWVPASDARDGCIQALNQLHYHDQQAPREIIVCAGFIGASASTLALAHKVNAAKDNFKKNILALKSTPVTLAQMGLPRLHLKQCYRKIPILPHNPLKIRWTWAHTRSIKKISVLQAQALLEKKGNDQGILMQIQKLSALPFHEPLAIVQELAPHLRANIVFPEGKTPHRLMIKGPLPIFFPCELQTPFPDFKPPSEKIAKDKNRCVRSDVRLDPHPFLPAIRAHRYVPALDTA